MLLIYWLSASSILRQLFSLGCRACYYFYSLVWESFIYPIQRFSVTLILTLHCDVITIFLNVTHDGFDVEASNDLSSIRSLSGLADKIFHLLFSCQDKLNFFRFHLPQFTIFQGRHNNILTYLEYNSSSVLLAKITFSAYLCYLVLMHLISSLFYR